MARVTVALSRNAFISGPVRGRKALPSAAARDCPGASMTHFVGKQEQQLNPMAISAPGRQGLPTYLDAEVTAIHLFPHLGPRSVACRKLVHSGPGRELVSTVADRHLGCPDARVDTTTAAAQLIDGRSSRGARALRSLRDQGRPPAGTFCTRDHCEDSPVPFAWRFRPHWRVTQEEIVNCFTDARL